MARLAQRLMRGVLAVWLLFALELGALATFVRRGFASVWELQWGSLWLGPTVLAGGALLGAMGAGVALLVEGSDRRCARGALGALGFAFGGVVAWGVGGGRHLEALPQRGGFAFAVAAAGAGAAWALAPWVARALRRAPVALAGGLGLGILLLSLANRFVLVHLYPAFHLGLAFATTMAAPLVAEAIEATRSGSRGGVTSPPRRRLHWSLGALGAVTLLAILTAPAAARRLAHFDNFRLLLLREGPLLGRAVEAATWLAPPAPFDEELAGCAEGFDCTTAAMGTRPTGPALDLRGADLLLVSIDALRADHVGAYGYERPTTPTLDALAAEGVVFEQAYCPTPHTSYSVTSMMTGKYLRPLLLQGAGEDSDTWAAILRSYGYRTAAFYPPALFFIDARRFASFRDRHLDFEYYRREFLEGAPRAAQVEEYLARAEAGRPVFIWVHLFAPHEPYEAHPEHAFGERDIDRYDSEIAFSDATLRSIVDSFRAHRPKGVVLVTADHGEEFGDHGGHYHGTSVFEEQVRVPLVISAPGRLAPGRIREVVQTIDLMPTVLGGLEIPRPPRLRGRDLGPLLVGSRAEGEGIALAETDDFALLAEGAWRLVCARRVGACQLFDLATDPAQRRDVGAAHPERRQSLRNRLRALTASHGTFEVTGLRAEGKGWPEAILRGVSGDGDAAEEIAALLDDADRDIRRKAAEVLFSLRRPETGAALRLALNRDEDPVVRRWSALTLTRLGQGAPLVVEMLEDRDLGWRRLAALALAEAGDRRGETLLVAWWRDEAARDFERSRDLLEALGKLRSEDALWPLVSGLDDVRLRPHIAATLARLGKEEARGPLARALAEERSQSTRVALMEALVALGAETELAMPLVRYLGVPDPLPGALGAGLETGILEHMGGPKSKDLLRLRRDAGVGAALIVVVPTGGNGRGVRVLVRARNPASVPAKVHVGARGDRPELDADGRPKQLRKLPVLDSERSVSLVVPVGEGSQEVHARLPDSLGAAPGRSIHLVVYAERELEVEALALVPLADELPPPPPQPWVTGSPSE